MSSPASSGVSWRFAAMGLLATQDIPRAFNMDEFEQALFRQNIKATRRTLQRVLQEWEVAKVIRRVARGVYLNMQSTPQPSLTEAVPKLRPGAIVSLATVLGDAGVLNNPTSWVMAVQPSAPNTRHANEVSSADGAVFQFAYMRADLVHRPGREWADDALVPYARVPTATPEKALLDWIYLSSSPRGAKRWPLPAAHDLDLDYLDMERLERLKEKMGLENEWQQFMDAISSTPRLKIRRSMR